MNGLRLLFWFAAVAAVLTAGIAYGCYRLAFYSAPVKEKPDIDIPKGKAYEPFREQMTQWIQFIRSLPREDVTVASFDGLKLSGKYYEYAPGAPVELMFHGYRGTAERDLSGGVSRCFALGRSALVVDQRGSENSEGHVITFGIREQQDCLSWVNFAVERFGPEVKIILTGISMGAATVMMAAGHPLPNNVIGILADCGYSAPKKIIYKVIRQMGLPPKLCYPFVKLGALLFGGFDPDSDSPEEALKSCRVPAIFFHGTEDDLVPHQMSEDCYAACASRKKLVLIPGAGHGLSYPVAPEEYLSALREFFGPEASFAENR